RTLDDAVGHGPGVSIRARAKRATTRSPLGISPPAFQSAPARRGRRRAHAADRLHPQASIRTRAKRATRHQQLHGRNPRRVSIRARAKRATYDALSRAARKVVSIRARAKRATSMSPPLLAVPMEFQSA